MSEQFQNHAADPPPRSTRPRGATLPEWLAQRLLAPAEEITWVRGPRYSPPWERYLTHPLFALAGVLAGGTCFLTGVLIAGPNGELPFVSGVLALFLMIGSICLVGFFAGYFTRLVVTNQRVVIVQGREVCRSWHIDDLPPSLIRYSMPGVGGRRRMVDLDALDAMLGNGSDQFADRKSIRALGKRLDEIKARHDRRPGWSGERDL